jgi:serine/threonine-protein kinase RsbW
MKTRKLILTNKLDQLVHLQRFLEKLGDEWDLVQDTVFDLNLVIEEYFSNLVCYGYSDSEDHEIILEFERGEKVLKLAITDDGNPFNILEQPENESIEKSLEERKIGGLGIHFIKNFTDHLEYVSDGKQNKLVIVKKLSA